MSEPWAEYERVMARLEREKQAGPELADALRQLSTVYADPFSTRQEAAEAWANARALLARIDGKEQEG